MQVDKKASRVGHICSEYSLSQSSGIRFVEHVHFPRFRIIDRFHFVHVVEIQLQEQF